MSNFLKVDNDDGNNEAEEEVSDQLLVVDEKELKKAKQSIFKSIINGDFSYELDPKLKQFIENYNASLDEHTGFFYFSNVAFGLASPCHGYPSL